MQLELALMSEEALHAWADELRAWAQWLVEVALNGRSPVTGLLRPLLRQRP
ncbi:hypothetical protein ACF8C6_02945 [Pseudomonas sp. zbq_18]|uniref:hypothetical protein n=1 Tax=Pseudomonas sp. zbq_18 TaxID=3367251 RepID=UPI00370B8EB3